ncbi:MAG: DMT family transporter [Rhizobiaceae bacterium]|jgi:drug/metabolite transporter (DMT)-like permease|nr:DMT family transporter [Rhizobiaceae bacterium]
MTHARPALLDYAMLLALAAMWGAAFLFSKIAVQSIEPFTATLLRQIVAAAIFVVLIWWTGERQAMTRADRVNAFLTAALGTGIPFALITWGVVEVDASIAAILMGLMPLTVLVLAHFTTQDEMLTVPKAFGVVLGLAGLILLFWPDITGGKAHAGSPLHFAAILAAAICYAVNALVTKRLRHLKPQPLYREVMLWTLVILAPLAFALESPLAARPTAEGWMAVIVLGVFSSAAGSLLLFAIVARNGATFFGQINFLVPLFGVVWGAVFLGERLTLWSGLALASILAGVAIARLPANRSRLHLEGKAP